MSLEEKNAADYAEGARDAEIDRSQRKSHDAFFLNNTSDSRKSWAKGYWERLQELRNPPRKTKRKKRAAVNVMSNYGFAAA